MLLVFGALPPAVLNFLFAERYNQEPERVASIVLIGNLAALLFLLAGGFFLARFKKATQRPDRVFAASLAELKEDLRQLKAAMGHEPPA